MCSGPTWQYSTALLKVIILQTDICRRNCIPHPRFAGGQKVICSCCLNLPGVRTLRFWIKQLSPQYGKPTCQTCEWNDEMTSAIMLLFQNEDIQLGAISMLVVDFLLLHLNVRCCCSSCKTHWTRCLTFWWKMKIPIFMTIWSSMLW